MSELLTVAPLQAVEQSLSAIWRGDPAVVVPSPPGAGKSGLVERAAVMCMELLGERVAVACQTGAQTLDLVRRLSGHYPGLSFVWFARSGVVVPDDVAAAANVSVVERVRDLPAGPCVVVGTSRKWEYVSDPFDVLIVDEAWQLADYAFLQFAHVGRRFLLVGDPGQIAPVITSDVRRWAHLVDGPHRPAPAALLHRRPDDVTVVPLPATRRLGQPTVDVVQPVFYPDLPFGSIRADRRFVPNPQAAHVKVLSAAADNEIVAAVLPAATPGIADREMAEYVAALVRDMIGGYVDTGGDDPVVVTAADVGVVCPHVVQVGLVQAALGPRFVDVRVDTTERWQGQEAEVMVVWHPMSGRPEATEFARDAGRLCVMLSRHRCATVTVWRDGTRDVLTRGGAGVRTLGDPLDRSYAGWQSNQMLFDLLEPDAVYV